MSMEKKSKLRGFANSLIFLGLALLLSSCQPVRSDLDPVIMYSPSISRIRALPSAFPPLEEKERWQEWAKELMIGDTFAKEFDFYRAITCYKRALILLPAEAIERHLQIDYSIILCYYLGQKYQEAINTFEESALTQVNALFPAFNNLLIMLYDCYREVGVEERAESLFELIQKCSPETAIDLSLYDKLKEGNLTEAQTIICAHPLRSSLQSSLDFYGAHAKSPKQARTLNALLPGAGYYYVGQSQAAATSFLINTLFTTAAYQFFKRGYVAAGAITMSIEMGWYLGGINGAGLEAEEFNSRLYEGVAKNLLYEHSYFPVLMFETAF